MMHEVVLMTKKNHQSLTTLAESHGMTLQAYLRRLVSASTPTVRNLNRGRVDTLAVKVANLYAAKFTDAQIAEALGCHISTVVTKRRALGLNRKSNRRSTSERAQTHPDAGAKAADQGIGHE